MPGAVDAKAINIHMQVTGPFASQMARNGQAVQTFGSQANAGMAKAQTGAAKFGATASKIATGGAVAIAVGLALSAKAAITFESSFAGVRKTVDTTEAGFQRLSDGIRKLATEIPVGVNELNRIAELGGQLGVDAPDLLEFSETIALIGVTTTLATEEAATGFARLDNIMQLGQDSFGEMGSTVVELGNNFAATEDEILNFALRVAPIGATVGLATDEVLAIATAFTSVGVRAERGGTAIQKTFIEIAEAAKTGGSELDTFARITGMTAEGFARLAETDPAAAFEAFITGLSKVDDEGGNVFATLDSLHLGNSRVVQSLLAMANAEGVLTDALNTADAAWEDNLALTEEAEKRFETTASQLGILKNQFIDAGIAIGSELLPFINNFIDGLGAILDWILSLNPVLKGLVAGLGGVSLALFALNSHPVILALTLAAGAVAAIGIAADASKDRILEMQKILADGSDADFELETILGRAGTNAVEEFLRIGFNKQDIRQALTGTQEEYESFVDKAKRTWTSLGETFDDVNDPSGLVRGKFLEEIGRARKDLAVLDAEAKQAEAERKRASRFGSDLGGAGDLGEAAANARSDVQAIFQARQGLNQAGQEIQLFPALLDSDQQDDVESAVDDYVSVFSDAFQEIDNELQGQINLFKEFGDDFEFVWADIVASAIRQTNALVAFETALLELDLSDATENLLRSSFGASTEGQEAFVDDLENNRDVALAAIDEIDKEVVGAVRKLAVAMFEADFPDLEFIAGAELLDAIAGIASDIAEDDLYNPLQAWLGVIEATRAELTPEQFASFGKLLKEALSIDSFVEDAGLGAQAVRDLIAEIDRIPTLTRAVIDVDFTGGFVPDYGVGSRVPQESDASFNAFGGTVMAGEPTWVGELGKEIFVPFSNGTIIPNSKLGGGDTEYNLNVYGSTNTADDAAAVLLTAQMIGKM